MASGYFDDTVIVLGAGASYDCKSDGSLSRAPLLSELISFYDREVQDGTTMDFCWKFGNLCDLVSKYYARGDSVYDAPSLHRALAARDKNLEDVFSFIDLSLEMWDIKESFGMMCHNARNELIRLLTEVFWKVHDNIAGSYSEECSNYATLARLISSSSRATVLTFNWDCLFEGVMGDLDTELVDNWVSSSLSRWCFNMSADSTWGAHNIIDRTLSRLELDNLFIKLHGSISWHVCENSDCTLNGWAFLENAKGTPIKPYEPLEICKSCGKAMYKLLVPPTFRKNLTRFNAISKQWIMARRRLLNAKRVVFIGYSFPPTDLASDWLFRTMALNPQLIVNVIIPERDRNQVVDKLGSIVRDEQIEDITPQDANYSFSEYCRNLPSE